MIEIEKDINKLGNIYSENFTGENYAGNVYDTDGICPALRTMQGGNQQPMIVETSIVAQRLEPRMDACTNTITTVQKDNLVLEKQIVKLGNVPMAVESVGIRQPTKAASINCQIGGVADLSYPDSKTRRDRVIDGGNTSPTLTTENIPNVLENWLWEIDGETYLIRIRKLTPKECWALMGFLPEDEARAAEVNSNTQLYKQAGNSIVVDVLMALFEQML